MCKNMIQYFYFATVDMPCPKNKKKHIWAGSLNKAFDNPERHLHSFAIHNCILQQLPRVCGKTVKKVEIGMKMQNIKLCVCVYEQCSISSIIKKLMLSSSNEKKSFQFTM